MSKFSVSEQGKDTGVSVDPSKLQAFAAGAKDRSVSPGPHPWDQYDPSDVQRYNVSVRMNDCQIEMLRYLAKERDTSQQKILNKIVVPAIKQLAEQTYAKRASEEKN